MNHVYRLALCAFFTASALHAIGQSKSWMLFQNDQSFNIQSMVQLPDQSVVVTGMPNVNWYFDSTYYGSTAMSIVRIAPNGNVLWAKTHESPGTYYTGNANSLFVTNNALYVTFASMDPMMNTFGSGLMKLDLNGNLLLSKSLSNGMDYAYGAPRYAQLPNGNIVQMKSLTEKFLVECFDADLNVIWSRSINPDSSTMKNPGMGLDINDDGDILVSGKSDNRMAYVSLSANGDYQYGFRFDNATKYFQARNVFHVEDGLVMQGLLMDYTGLSYMPQSFVCKVNTSGNIEWLKVIKDVLNPAYDFSISKSHVTEDGSFVFGGFTLFGSFACGALDKSGNVTWSRVSNGANAGGTYGYYTWSDAPLCLQGNSVALVQYQTLYPYGNTSSITFTDKDALVNNNVCGLVETQVTAFPEDFDYAIHTIPASSMAVLNNVYTPVTIELVTSTSQFETVESCETVTGLNTVSGNVHLSMYPNPASDQLHVTYGKDATIKIYNAVGALVMDQNISAGKTQIDVTSLSSGVYVATVIGDGLFESQKFSVQR